MGLEMELETTKSTEQFEDDKVIVEEAELVSDEQDDAEKKPSFLKKVKEKVFGSEYFYLVGAFFLPLLIMIGAHAAMSYFPFGNQSILTLDFQAQYIYYFENIRHLLTEGGSWLYTWSRSLGGEFMGYVAYYMGSPFNIIVALFPAEKIVVAVATVVLMKIGTMGLTMGIYLHKKRNLSELGVLIFSTLYALCGYVPVQQFNPMWLDALVWLPLLVLGIERLIEKRKILLYIISLTLIVTANYYIGYMCCIFTALYFVYYYFLVRPKLMEENPVSGKGIGKLFRMYGTRTFFRMAISTVIVLMSSAFMLICAYYSLGFGKLGFSNPSFAFNLKFDFLDLFMKMLMGSYDTVRTNGLPLIYSGLLSLTLIPVFYLSKGISGRKKVLISIFLAVMIFSFMFNPVDLAWHGFSTPNWLNYRYSFLFSFLIISMASEAFEHFKEVKFGYYAGSCAAILILTFIVQKLNYSFSQGSRNYDLHDIFCILFSVIAVGLYAAIMFAIFHSKKSNAAVIALAVIISIETFGNAAISIGEMENDVGTVRYNNYTASSNQERYDSYNGSVERLRVIYDEVLKKDSGFFRTESTIYRQRGGVNEQMSAGFYGISSSTSTLNKATIRLLEKMGYASTSHWSKYLGGTPIGDALLGIKYVLTSDRPSEANGGTITLNNKHSFDPNIYVKAAEVDEPAHLVPSNYKIYAMQNTKALPIAYGVSRNIEDFEDIIAVKNYYTAMDLQNRLIKSMLSEQYDDIDVFKPLMATYTYSHCTLAETNISYNWDGESQNSKYYVATKVADDPSITFTTTAVADGIVYFHFPTVNFGMSAKVYVNGKFITDYFDNETTCAMELGNFSAGEKIRVELKLNDNKLYIADSSESLFWYVDYEAMNEAFESLADSSMEVTKFGNDYIEGNAFITEGKELMFTTIPYDKGWNVYVDGKKVETTEVLGSLLAFEIDTGYHEISMKYFPKEYGLGIAVSAVGILIIVVIAVYTLCPKFRDFVKKTFSKKKSADEPENEPDEQPENTVAAEAEPVPSDNVNE